MSNKVLVIGGGAAGMIAAIFAALNGAKVTVWEQNRTLGRKLAITGKGRCNLTNDASISEIISNMPGNGRFLYSSLNAFAPQDIMEFFTTLGVPLKVERGKRVFPQSDRANDIIIALQQKMEQLHVEVCYEYKCQKLEVEGQHIKGAWVNEQLYLFDKVIIATGGLSYPATGSTGDGYRWAKKVGHTVTALYPSLVPLETAEKWVSDLSGLSLRNVELSAYCDNQLLGQEFGEMLFTHWGISGPVVLSLSRAISAHLKANQEARIILQINLKPALSREQLDKRLLRDFEQFSRKHLLNSLNQLLPQSLIPVFLNLTGMNPDKPCNQITKEERNKMIDVLTALHLTITKTRPFAEAIITAGGVNVKEINPKTMESKLVENLYFAGEILDIDGYTGGFNLQAAFASGKTAGSFAAE